MRILVIGGTQFFGQEAVRRFLARGDQVTVYSRGRSRPDFWDRVEHVAGDRTDHAAFVTALRGRAFDVVVDNVAFRRADVEAAVEAFRGRIGHYILTSSGSVYPDFAPRDALRTIPEDAADLTLRGDHPYAEGKRACEQAVRAQDAFPFTVVRPPIVQGPHDASLRGWFWYQRIADGGPVLVPDGYPAFLWRQAYSGDVAEVFARAALNPVAYGRTFNVASDEILTLADFVRLAADLLDRGDPAVVIPAERLTTEAAWYRPTYAHRFVMDTTALRRDLGVVPTPFPVWLEETVRWHLNAGLPPAAGYDRRPDEVDLARLSARR